jgi:hypothetical protein
MIDRLTYWSHDVEFYCSHPVQVLNISTADVVVYLYERFDLAASAEHDAYV